MKKKTIQTASKKNTTLWIGLGVIALLGGATSWMVKKRKEKEEAQLLGITEDSPKEIKKMGRTSTSRFRCINKAYPLGYGTCHADVKILQRYLKIYKEDLGSSGATKDGVDGMFGSKTAKAARKHLGKVSFTKQDIQGMKTSIKIIKV